MSGVNNKKNKMKKFIIGAGALLIPGLAFAQTGPNFGYFTSLFSLALEVLNTYIIPGIIILATIYFLWTVVQYIKGKDASEQKTNRDRMMQGIIGLTVIVAVWGIVAVITNLVGIGGSSTKPPACPPGYQWNTISKKCA